MSKPSNRPYSSQVVDGLEKAAARAMLHAVGFTEADFSKPQVGIASTWSNLTPCNVHINELAEAAAIGVEDAAAKAITRLHRNGGCGSRIRRVCCHWRLR